MSSPAVLFIANCTVEVELFPNSSDSYIIANPALIPWCLLAAYIGITRFSLFRQMAKNTRTSLYALCFLMYATMMTNAMFADSILANYYNVVSVMISYVDLSMTSSIAVVIMFCGLYDCNLIDPINNIRSRAVMTLCVGSVWLGWFIAFRNDAVTTGFIILYLGVIGVCCPTYLILEIHYIRSKNVSSEARRKFILTGLSGAVGFMAMMGSKWLCHTLSTQAPLLFTFLNGIVIWFMCSDAAMYFLGEFVINSHGSAATAAALGKYQALDIEFH